VTTRTPHLRPVPPAASDQHSAEPPEISDDALMVLAEGDPRAFATLVRRHEPALHRLATLLVNDPERARELTQYSAPEVCDQTSGRLRRSDLRSGASRRGRGAAAPRLALHPSEPCKSTARVQCPGDLIADHQFTGRCTEFPDLSPLRPVGREPQLAARVRRWMRMALTWPRLDGRVRTSFSRASVVSPAMSR